MSEVPAAVGPLAAPGVLGRVLPFALVATGVICVLGFTGLQDPVAFERAALVAGVLIAVTINVPWRRLPVVAQNFTPLAAFAVVVLLREAGGGSVSGVGPLALVPVCWLAMYAGRVALGIALALTGGVFLGPWLLVGGAAYPDGDLRRGLILVLVSVLVGVSVQTLVRTLHTQQAAAEQAAHRATVATEQLLAVARVRHRMRVGNDPREAICEGARDLSGAAMSLLLEPQDRACLVLTASTGVTLAAVSVPMDPARSAGADCLLSGRRIMIADARSDPRIPQDLRSQADAVSMLYEPVVRRSQVVAVLAVGWHRPADLGGAAVAAVSLMAEEAAVALEQADLLATVQKLAHTDQLTALPNRRAFDDLLPVALQGATRSSPLCVALLDLDFFKKYNDTFGHQAGDRFLQDTARVWSQQLRRTDVLARFGGEEFVVVLPDCALEDAVTVLDKLRRNTPGSETVSIGIAQWDGVESQPAMIRRVDKALYRAKDDGRNRLCCAA